MHILSATQFTPPFIDALFEHTMNIEKYPHCFHGVLRGKILLNVFFEPSTRTSLSFESAMKQLGGDVINFNHSVSSMIKGESYEDTIRTLATYGHIMALRDPEVNNIHVASTMLKMPLINGGNGSGEHPTQALLDLYTIYKTFNSINDKKIMFVGDVKNSRTVHSLINLLHLYPTNQIFFMCYDNCEPEMEFLERINRIHDKPCEVINLQTDFSDIDVVYCTRYQRERVQKDGEQKCVIDVEFMRRLKPDAIVMYPLPRNSEIDPRVDNDKRCVYFEQMRNGVELRKVLLLKCFDKW